jgi:hypothetical protein
MAIRNRKTRRRLRSKRAHSRKGSRRQRGGSGSTLGDLVAVLLSDIDFPLDSIKLLIAHSYGLNGLITDITNFDDLYDEDIYAAEINKDLEISDESIRNTLTGLYTYFVPGVALTPEEQESVEELFKHVKAIAARETAKEKGRNTIALQYVAKAPQNGSRAANVLLHPQLSGVIGEQLSGKKGSLPSQVNKLKQNIGIPGVPRA